MQLGGPKSGRAGESLAGSPRTIRSVGVDGANLIARQLPFIFAERLVARARLTATAGDDLFALIDGTRAAVEIGGGEGDPLLLSR